MVPLKWFPWYGSSIEFPSSGLSPGHAIQEHSIPRHSIPEDRMDVLFITGYFTIQDGDVDATVDGLLEYVHDLPHVPAVVLTAIRTFTLSPNRLRIKESYDYIDIDYCLAPYVKERVLIIKNRSCRFPFDYSMLSDVYTKRNEFSYRYDKP